MIDGSENQTNNSIKEKYCFNNDPGICSQYGGLYQWNEMMQYTTQQGVQGICPPGWHLPGDEEWKVLEGAVDGQYGIGDQIWDDEELRGFDAGTNLKTSIGWNNGGNGTDMFGFSSLPGGYRAEDGDFLDAGGFGHWWASTEFGNYDAWTRSIHHDNPGVGRYNGGKEHSFSVRCLRD